MWSHIVREVLHFFQFTGILSRDGSNGGVGGARALLPLEIK